MKRNQTEDGEMRNSTIAQAHKSISSATDAMANALKQLQEYQSAISAVQHLLNDATEELSNAMDRAFRDGNEQVVNQLDSVLADVRRVESVVHCSSLDVDGQSIKIEQEISKLTDIEFEIETVGHKPARA
jgi:DNA repair ATPase RecN